MLVTLSLSLVMMAGLFLMLYAAVALVQDKRFFTSAPKDVQDAVQPKPERFPSARKVGWRLILFSLVLMAWSLYYAGVNGVGNGFTFGQFFLRYLVMFLLLKAFDVLFFDLVLLCHSNFFPRWYPEVKGIVGPHQFGYNWKTHLLHIVLSPVVSLALAWLCTALA